MHRSIGHPTAVAVCATLVAALLAATGCSSRKAPKSVASTAVPRPMARTLGLAHPESVRYDSAADVYYVSVINGDPAAHDDNGFIDVVSADSFRVILTLVRGGQNGVTLDAPKGLAVSGDTLWVADIDAVRAFDKHNGSPLLSVDLKPLHARFLNDVAVGGDGAVYVTDTGTGDSTNAGGNVIFRIADGRASVALASPALAAPNGIAWSPQLHRFLLAPGGKDVQTWAPGDRAPVPFAAGPGTYDGIEPLADGRIVVTSWADSAVHIIQDGQMTTWIRHVNGPADIGVDVRRGRVALPRLVENRVEYFLLPVGR